LSGGETVLYLGAASGTTVSHVADFAGPTYAVEFAPRPARRTSLRRLSPAIGCSRF